MDAVFFSEIGLPKMQKSMYNGTYTVIRSVSSMKILAMIVPVLVLLVFMRLSTSLLASGTVNPLVMIGIAALGMVAILAMRPKNKGVKAASNLEKKARGEFALDAFADDAKLESMFLAAIKDYNGNMPKAALAKLTKLAPQCTGDKEIYAVSMATAQCHLILGKPLLSIREYTRALSIHPTAEVAMELGSCHQRLGNLDKARDAYEFALDLDAENLEALSRIATTYVADHDWNTALDYANRVIDKEENNSSALATAAICHGLLNNEILHKHYTELAVENGYTRKKIEETVFTLKKRSK